MEQINFKMLLERLNPISLKELDSVKLLNRVDRKYIIPVDTLPHVIQLLVKNQYSILEIDGHKSFRYLTTYFDTTDYRFYKDHHNHLTSRIKVRTRTYKENNLHFFEIKMKSNARTNKLRERLSEQTGDLTEIQKEKIISIYPKKTRKRTFPGIE